MYSGGAYDLPQGSVGREFVRLLADEISMLARKLVSSERVMVLCRVILQRNYEVKRGSDICITLERRLTAWKDEQFDSLVQETTQCARQLAGRKLSKNNQDHVMKVFTRLMLRGDLRAATRWMTERGSNSVLNPLDVIDHETSKTALDVLKEKHPDPAMSEEGAFGDGELPTLVDISVTSGHVERVARALHGGAGPSGTNSGHWKSFLLRFGNHSAKLYWGAIAELIMMIGNGIVDWSIIMR